MDNTLIITVENEQGEKIKLQLIETIEVDNNKYSLLAPMDEEEKAYIYRAVDLGHNNTRYDVIEDNEEFNRVLEAYESMFDD